MATLAQKITAEHRMRELLEDNGLPAPDAVEYGDTCVRLFWREPKTCLVIDIDKPPPRWASVGERLDDAWEDDEADEEEGPM
jgi:hypothetical protein